MHLLQRRSRRSLALRGASRGDLTGNNNSASLSNRRLSLEKAQLRKAASSQKALDSRQTLEGRGIADGHQKPSGTAVNPLADVETGQMHLDTAMETGDLASHSQATSNNAGGFSCHLLVMSQILSKSLMKKSKKEHIWRVVVEALSNISVCVCRQAEEWGR